MDALLTLEDVAKRFRVSPDTVWKLVATGGLPKPVYVLGEARWRKLDIKKFMASLSQCKGEPCNEHI
jgi:predicted DNA-binding transcriptional regulator AlpA